MHFFYIIVALTLSIGFGTFTAYDSQRMIVQKSEQNRAVAFQEQAQVFARSVRRQVALSPSAYRGVSGRGSITLSDQQLGQAEFGGYKMQGRFRYILESSGRVVVQLTDDALSGPNAITGKYGDTIQALVAAPPEGGGTVGSLDLKQLGVLK